MRVRWPAGRTSKAPMVPLLAAAVLFGPAPGTASALACTGWTLLKPPSPGAGNLLSGVAAVSPRRAWAVGQYINRRFGESTLLAHWDGAAWTRVPSPNPAGITRGNFLAAVAATSSTNAWAVGTDSNGSMILRWNGVKWKQVASPSGRLAAVATTSPANAWAVGAAGNESLILHWNGTKWKRVPSPPGGLTGVAATSATDAWAVGCTAISGCAINGPPGGRTMILHWNGVNWERVPSPNPAGRSDDNFLFGVAGTASANAWAVGFYTRGAGEQTLIAHWNGTTWKRVPSPNPDSFSSVLYGVAAVSSANAWAVGAAGHRSLIAHWNGFRWKQVPSPNPGPSFTQLYGVAAPSAGDIWAVGAYEDSKGFQHTLALRRC